MVLGDILFKMRKLAMDSVSHINLPTYYSDLYCINTTLDYDIIQMIKKLTKIIKAHFPDINDNEAFSTALYAAYYELQKKNNQILKEHLTKIGSLDRFTNYYRNACKNPFA